MMKEGKTAAIVAYDEVLAKLNMATPRGDVKTRPGRGGVAFTYVDTAYIIQKLNEVTNHVWSFAVEMVSPWELMAKSRQVVVKGTITAFINGNLIEKSQFGSGAIQMLSDGSGPVDVGDDLKGAASDALKKCASLLGIAADVYSGNFKSAGHNNSNEAASEHKTHNPADGPKMAYKNPDAPMSVGQTALLNKLISDKESTFDEFMAWAITKFGIKGSTDLKMKHMDESLSYLRSL